MTSSAVGYGLKRAESKYVNENYIKEDNNRSIFDKSFVESRIIKEVNKGVYTSEFRSLSPPPLLKDNSSYKETASAIYNLGSTGRGSN